MVGMLRNSLIPYLQRSKDDTDGELLQDIGLIKNFSFTSIGGGSGSSTIILYLAQYLVKEKGKRVCILDLNLLQPDLLYNLNVDVTSENTVLQYLKGFKSLEDCLIQDEVTKGLYLITASPKDPVELITTLDSESDHIGKLIDGLDVFDYVLINLPYIQPFITLVEPISRIDRGYIVIDERLSSINKIELFLKYIHDYHDKLNHFNQVIINKRSMNDYPLEEIEGKLCDIISEIPYDDSLRIYMNSKKPLIGQQLSRSVLNSFSEILKDMLK